MRWLSSDAQGGMATMCCSCSAKCHPFEAHCWAQIGQVVLTDPLERVLRFQPILAL
jgi:hypothetical protein